MDKKGSKWDQFWGICQGGGNFVCNHMYCENKEIIVFVFRFWFELLKDGHTTKLTQITKPIHKTHSACRSVLTSLDVLFLDLPQFPSKSYGKMQKSYFHLL